MTSQTITTAHFAEDGALLVPMLGAALGPETQAQLRELFKPDFEREEESDGGRIKAWHLIAEHPFFADCYESEDTLINAMIAKLDSLAAPKPWWSAQRGDVWLVKRDSYPTETLRTVGENQNFIDVHSKTAAFDITDAAIITARRVWPETEEYS